MHTNTQKPRTLQFAHIQPYKKHANVHSHKLPQPRYSSKAVIYYPVCACMCVCAGMYVFPIKGEGGGGGGGWKERVLYSTHINHVEEK